MRTSIVLGALALYASGVVAQTSSAVRPASAPAANTSSSASPSSTSSAATPAVSVNFQLPQLVQCQSASFAFSNAPVGVQKTFLFFLANQPSQVIERFDFPPSFNDLSSGAVDWLCDFPVSLSVMVYMYSLNGSSVPDTWHAASGAVTVAAGLSSACLAQNSGQNTASILSLASSINPAFVADPTQSAGARAANQAAQKGGSNAGPIAGGVVGGVAAIAIIGLVLFWLRGRHERRELARLEGSVYGGASEKGGPASTYHGGFPRNADPRNYFVPYDEYGRPLNENFNGPPTTAVPMSEAGTMAPSTKPSRPMGTLPEPMDADAETRQVDGSERGGGTLGTPARSHPTTSPSAFTPISEGQDASELRGTEGLDDPSTFSPTRAHLARNASHDGLAES